MSHSRSVMSSWVSERKHKFVGESCSRTRVRDVFHSTRFAQRNVTNAVRGRALHTRTQVRGRKFALDALERKCATYFIPHDSHMQTWPMQFVGELFALGTQVRGKQFALEHEFVTNFIRQRFAHRRYEWEFVCVHGWADRPGTRVDGDLFALNQVRDMPQSLRR